jgi:hypothetical protein
VASSPRNAPEAAPETDLYPFHLVNLWSSLCRFANVDWHCGSRLLPRTSSMIPASQAKVHSLPRRALSGAALAGALAVLAGCSGISEVLNKNPPPGTAPSPVQSSEIGTGAVRVALILPLSAGGNAGTVAQSMKNAGEMALAEFNSPNIQLLVKDDGGTSGGAQQAAQQALAEGAEIIIGPLFAHSVGVVGAAARQRGVPVIAFSTDATVATRGVYLLSFLPESDVDRIVDYAVANGKRSFVAMLSPCCRKAPTATWWKASSSRRWRARAQGSSAWSATHSRRRGSRDRPR